MIPPGRFLMGSPEGEPGRSDLEGPQREVTFSSGFWLFDTPVTQALWEAVMGENPSHFKGADRPVERALTSPPPALSQKAPSRHRRSRSP